MKIYIFLLTLYCDLIEHSNELLIRVKSENSIDDFLEEFGQDVWFREKNTAELRINRTTYDSIDKKEFSDIDIEVINENLQRLIDSETKANGYSKGQYFKSYHNYEELVDWYKRLSEKNDFVKFIKKIGKTKEGRNIPAVHIKTSKNPKKVILMQSLIHAREWISGAALQYAVNRIVKGIKKDKEVKRMFNSLLLIIVPVVNPDGYEYTWNTDRMWRKNRSGSNGVDINRNFPFKWGGEGASSDPNQENYRGPKAASENETKALIKLHNKYRSNMVGAIDVHAHGEMILRPYGYSTKNSKHESKLKKLGQQMFDAIKKNRGLNYRNIKASELYPASGGAFDWYYEEGPKYSYAFELSPGQNGGNGFVLDPKNIIPVGKELADALKVFIAKAVKNPLK